MPFRDIILFYLLKYLLTENHYSMRMIISLCRVYDIKIEDLIVSALSKKYLRKFSKILSYPDVLLPEISICFPENIIHELLLLRVQKFSKSIRASYRLTKNMKGIVIVKNRYLFVVHANDDLLNYLFKEYNPQLYIYDIGKPSDVCGSKMILCGYSKIKFYTSLVTNIITNQKIDIVVTEKCIELLAQNEQLVKDLFDKSNDKINRLLRQVFYSVLGGGQTP
ncbi:transcriptional elongation factor [Deerpox virus W-848-83]|uniref:Late transcription elongation factor OPG087 n=1 Tax=Deerpox virus (strain Mule deer/United States/W-848-83/1983) TaxID=305674 RepID=Q08FU1_DPV83|nr:Transcriptional elongation factor [Deerpox virus W-848-83]ABI99216.1 transcriptional elongation factor [Deerpox virus W-848-83]